MTNIATDQGAGVSGKIKVLDKGFVRFIDVMGDDNSVVQAARVSYDQGMKGEEKDRGLIHYLLSHKHTTPFEQVQFKFHVKAPVFAVRQWFRHRMASYNEISQRYAVIKNEFYIPSEWRTQSKTNKQGSADGEINHQVCASKLEEVCLTAYHTYEALIREGASKEMARFALPINVYTEFYISLNAHNLMAFIRLRSEIHAQWEIRQYSNVIFKIFKARMPWTAEAFVSTLDPMKYTIADRIVKNNL